MQFTLYDEYALWGSDMKLVDWVGVLEFTGFDLQDASRV